MNKFLLAAFLAQTASATVVYDAVDDPRCHDEPSRPVLEPTPGPTPYPDPPTNDRIVPLVTTAPPPEVPCTGEVTGFAIVDLDDPSNVTPLTNGADLVKLSDLPASFTVQAITSGDDLEIKMFFNDALVGTGTSAPYMFGDSNFLELNTEGVYNIKAVGPTDTPGLTCELSLEIEYGNPHNCEGVITQFALFDTNTQAIVPGYDLLESGQVLKKVDLPHPHQLTLVAISNGRGTGDIEFSYGSDAGYFSTSDDVAAITGKDADGNILPWEVLNQQEFVRIKAKTNDAMNVPESKFCEIELQIEHDWECPYIVSGFALIQADTHNPIPGYENIIGYRAVDLKKIHAPAGLTIEAHSSKGKKVEFFMNGKYVKSESWSPYAINGDNSAGQHEFEPLREPGQYVFEAKHTSESNDKRCQLILTVQKDENVHTIDNTEYCAPEAVVPEQVGNVMFASTPVVVATREVNSTVSFNTVQKIADQTMDWVTTVFVTESGYEVCDKIDNMAKDAVSTNLYEAKCVDGFAYADVYASSSSFAADEATADTSMLPPGCKDASTKVVKYTFVFSCDCDAIPDIPDSFIGGPNKGQQFCTGVTGYSWGDPHVIPFHGSRSNGWNCQGEGEFVLSKATLEGYPYDFELHSRFTMFGQDLPWTFNSGMVAKTDVSVQISMGEIGDTSGKPNMMDNVPIHFYVDGVPRYFNEGTGDIRVKLYVDGFHVYVTFVETGIQVHVQVRPFYSDKHSGIMNGRDGEIPGSFTTYLCMPDGNDAIKDVMGLLGTPTPSMTDNFMSKSGQQMSKPSNLKQYCEDEWCITDASQTMFAFESGKSFADYNKCGSARRQLNERELVSRELQEFCLSECDDDDICIEECHFNGEEGIRVARLEMAAGEMAQRNSRAGVSPDDARCFSRDHKNCLSEEECPTQNEFYCVAAAADDPCCDGTVFLSKGTYELHEGMYKDCVKKGDPANGADCCPKLTTDADGTCVRDDSSERRMLEEFKFQRPGVADLDNRNIVPLHTEL